MPRSPQRHSLVLPAILFGVFAIGCSPKKGAPPEAPAASPAQTTAAASAPAGPIFTVDPATAGTLSGTVHMVGPHLAPKPIDMSEDPACVKAHHGRAVDESLLVGKHGGVANAFVYVKSGLEGKNFAVPQTPVTLDQSGCWFRPRVLGIQVGQELRIVNSDPVTHNIHPMAETNREWNHSQGPGDPPLVRRFTKPEVMIPVKCNIHSWMHAWFGVLPHPYFAVTSADGDFTIPDLPPGTYTIGIWQEKLGTQEQQVTIPSHGKADLTVTFKGK